MDSPLEWPRKSFQEAMDLSRAPDKKDDQGNTIKRFMSHQPAWNPGAELPWDSVKSFEGSPRSRNFGPGAAFGGVVYGLAPLAAARAVEEDEREASESMQKFGRLGIHTIQGVFTKPGFVDRPFVFDVSAVSSSRSFSTRLVNARQPIEPSANARGPFELSDASRSLGDICFTCLTTFKRPVQGLSEVQDALSVQERYVDILSYRDPTEWPLCPQVDIDLIVATFPNQGHGAFPIFDMHKVDMATFNATKHIPDRRELILYRLLKPLPSEDANAHVVAHAFGTDRNSLAMVGNYLGYGSNFGIAASLSLAFYVHVNAEEAVMRGDGWWVQDICWPRVGAGRVTMVTKVWSPEGTHVATAYQDGLIVPARTDEGTPKL